MSTPADHPQTPAVQHEQEPHMRLYGFTERMQARTKAEHSMNSQEDIRTPVGVEAAASPDRAPSRVGLRRKIALLAGGILGSAAILIPGGASAEDSPGSNVDTEKTALAAFGNNAVTRTADSFASPKAQTSANKGMKPKEVMRRIVNIFENKTDGAIGFGGSIHKTMDTITSTSLTPNEVTLKGSCESWVVNQNVFLDFVQIRPKKQRQSYCGTDFKSKVSDDFHPKNHFSGPLNRLGRKAAASVGVASKSIGKVKRSAATTKKATILYARNASDNAPKRQLKKLVLRAGKQAQRTWYKVTG